MRALSHSAGRIRASAFGSERFAGNGGFLVFVFLGEGEHDDADHDQGAGKDLDAGDAFAKKQHAADDARDRFEGRQDGGSGRPHMLDAHLEQGKRHDGAEQREGKRDPPRFRRKRVQGKIVYGRAVHAHGDGAHQRDIEGDLEYGLVFEGRSCQGR